MEYTFMVYSLFGKGMVLSKIVFQSGNRHSTDKKDIIMIQYKSKLVLWIT